MEMCSSVYCQNCVHEGLYIAVHVSTKRFIEAIKMVYDQSSSHDQANAASSNIHPRRGGLIRIVVILGSLIIHLVLLLLLSCRPG